MPNFALAEQCYRQNVWRAKVFRDLVLSDTTNRERPVLLDIGCGKGFDNSAELQAELATAVGTGQYCGVERDPDVKLEPIFSTVYRCSFEDAAIAPASVDVAFCIMVLEHIARPEVFFGKVAICLKPGGVFWGFTVDARHPFVSASVFTEKAHIKDLYLNWVHGNNPEQGRYKNYPTYYRANTPRQIERFTKAFSSRSIVSLWSANQLDFYFPRALRWVGRGYSYLGKAMGWPALVLVIRLEK